MVSRPKATPGGLPALALRALPQVQKLMEDPEARALVDAFSRPSVLRSVRDRLQDIRLSLLHAESAASDFSSSSFFSEIREQLELERLKELGQAINATGIVIHTNLGRAPLAAEAIAAVAEVAGGYSNLEYDLASGRRGSRYQAVEGLLRDLTGAEAALVVNNNAAAVLLTLKALAEGGEVIVSRGELVEIGGSFRIPDIIAYTGAKLVEVGTTNKTHLSDYEQAITADTRVILKVHQSNYRIAGFTSAPEARDLVRLAHERGLAVVEDLGSGTITDLRDIGLPYEPTVGHRISAGFDIVTFSGDKLLGGPQAGMILGRKVLVDRLRMHPLLRAVRIDKLNLAALVATLRLYRDAAGVPNAIPVIGMLSQDEGELAARAEGLERLLAPIAGLDVHVAQGVAYAGGGALPEASLATRLVTVRPERMTVEELSRRLRRNRPAIIGRIAERRFMMDVRTLAEGDLPTIAEAFRRVLA